MFLGIQAIRTEQVPKLKRVDIDEAHKVEKFYLHREAGYKNFVATPATKCEKDTHQK